MDSSFSFVFTDLKVDECVRFERVLEFCKNGNIEVSKMHNKDACSPSSNGGLATNQMQSNGAGLGPLYSTLFSDKPSLSTTSNGGVSINPYEGNSPSKFNDSAIQSHLYDSCAIQKHQDMVNRHTMCLNRLAETTKEVEALRHENTQLRAVNRELNKQLSLLIQVSVQNQLDGSSGHSEAFDVVNGFRGLHIADNFGEGKENCADWNKDQEVSNESPTSVIENTVEVERFSLPKSISVRSNGYLKVAPQTVAGASSQGNRTKGPTRPRTSSTPPDVVQKVYVRGGKEEEPLEMVVYNQGMFKTELCNKWQETGTCPYKDQCQFAHGIDELRPVIRHPRYKTEVCRMVLAGVVCPYGHRCHFRHALTEQEKAIAQPKPSRAMNLHR
ncbi:Zinc finger CCCH domain-containing protein 15 [Senna tora]|uniref:Zinc finger CCCH domain-containing protein 15 n=1 Tax=Senna tora TaxID=362788 RepID=A0A834TWN8_9FABA|nr:Zinc finger CCCH domain-containing protein 15 [Senna tora]